MLDKVKRYDMKRKIGRQHLNWLIRLLSVPALISHKNKIEKIGMEEIRPPYLLLCNHNAFMDFKVATKAIFPARANYVVAIDGFIGRESLMRFIGCICKRKFTNDVTLVRQLMDVVKKGDIAAIYPEARYSLCGTTAVLPDSLGKLVKLLGVPVVTLICHGHHINSPFWNLPDHKVKGTTATMKCIATEDEVKTLSHEELMQRIRTEFVYDDFKWQKENKIKVNYKNRAKGLHKVLYQCPNCLKEFKMDSDGTLLWCNSCGKKWNMNEYGQLEALEGKTEFSHIPDWYEWERANVRREVESGSYNFDCTCHVDSLPNAKDYIHLGKAKFHHGMDGFILRGEYKSEKYEIKIPVPDAYSVHIEYEYLGKFGDCVDLNTINDTLYVYPEACDFAVTKISLAAEELYSACKKK